MNTPRWRGVFDIIDEKTGEQKNIILRSGKYDMMYVTTGCLKKNEPQFLLNFSGYIRSRKLGRISN